MIRNLLLLWWYRDTVEAAQRVVVNDKMKQNYSEEEWEGFEFLRRMCDFLKAPYGENLRDFKKLKKSLPK